MMPDREKVIKGLECCCASKANRCETNSCPYWKSEICCIDEMLSDALALLKQEAVEPYVAGSGESFETAETWWYECGNCNKPIDPNDKFCRHCGQELKWNG